LKFTVRNSSKDTRLGDSIETADSSSKRRTGLLKHTSLAEGAGLWIVPCEAIHTFFMRFPIDVVYIDKKRHVRKLVRALQPWRMSMCLPAHSVIELPAGTIERTRTQVGDELQIIPSPD
jgi:uncharacterized protein